MLHFDILSIFPDIFESYFNEGTLKGARDKGLIEINLINIRDYTKDRHRSVDDYPFGGGYGMVMKPEPIYEAIEDLKRKNLKDTPWVILLSPQGGLFDHSLAERLARKNRIVLICGRYEGVDERVRLHFIDEEISIGDYILSGGELPAMVVVETTSRLIPGVLGGEGSLAEESLTNNILEYPQYTRPREYRGFSVPDVLISGDHARIEDWRREKALNKTLLQRPDLLAKANLSKKDMEILSKV